MIYLDHGATTPMHPQVIETMTDVMTTVFGNPSSIHQLGRQAQHLVTTSRQKIAQSIHAEEDDIMFTSGGTESDNTAIIQTAHSRQHLGKHIITSKVEHPAVLRPMEALVEEGFEVTFLPVDEQGLLSVDDVLAALRPDTILVSLMWTNNETGVRFPIKEIGSALQEHQTYFHTDAVQAYGLETIDVEACHLDLLSATGHKINGPKGTGFLYCRSGISLPPFMRGGEQEEHRRAGTENVPAITGLAKASDLLTETEKRHRQLTYREFHDQILTRLRAEGIDFEVNGDQEQHSAHVLNLWFSGVPNNLLLMHLDLKGIALSIGSACTAGNVHPSHVLETMFGKDAQRVAESVRFSFGLGNTSREIDYMLDHLVPIINRLKK